ncbi:S41 family peptidase [Porphyromonas pogonae]|uniref:S41 family peptidase n=1 Tax=Porphyromonas pogonae TaxID=867595 RepID=UPI002E768369|nr:S41 family peptidase [Porphyromonas pogonae]
MKKAFISLLLFGVSACFAAHAQSNPLWLRNAAISPDGKEVAFTYKGDIYTVSSQGGRANQITSQEAYDTKPVWSPSGKQIAFASDREGGFDVYIVSREGGAARRITFNSANEIPEVFKSDSVLLIQANILPDVKFSQFPGTFSQIYQVKIDGSRPALFSSFLMENMSLHGDKILYTDKKGYEDPWRKHQVSSIARDVWMLDRNKHTKLTSFKGEDRNAVWAKDGKTYYYLSEQDGTFNVYSNNIQGGTPKQLTNFSKNPVRYLSADNNNTLCFSYNGEIYTMLPGAAPRKLNISIISDNYQKDVDYQTLRSGAESMAVSPNGKEIAFVARGDVYVTSVEYGTTKRITNTAEQERDVDFRPDGRGLVYSAERGGTWNIYQTELSRKEDKSFCYARDLKETQLTNTKSPSFQPIYSPDGKEVAYLEDRSEIRVYNLASKQSRTVMEGKYNYSYMDGDQDFAWSPDSKWIVTDYIGIGGWNNKDIALVKADGSKKITNLTQSGYTDTSAKWVLGGKAIIWHSDRAGYRSHGSWGAESDIYIMFLDAEAYDKFVMSKEDLALKEEMDKVEKDNKTDDGKDKSKDKSAKQDKKSKEKKDDKAKDAKADVKKSEPLEFDLDNREYRILRLTRNSGSMSDAVLDPKGEKMYFIAKYEDTYDLMMTDFKEYSTKVILPNIGQGQLISDKDVKTLFLLSKGTLQKIEGPSVKPISFEAQFAYKPEQERIYIFNHVWKQVKDKFYDPKLHGVDWAYYKDNYSKFLPYINNDYDFAEMLSEMLGELNASHTGARYFGGRASRQTASLGAFFDESFPRDGLKIIEIMKGSPLSNAKSKFKPGVIIEMIDGEPIKAGKPYTNLLDGKAGKRVVLTAFDPSTNKRFEEIVKPISSGYESELQYKRWVKKREEIAEKYSGGRIAYVHVRGMNSGSFREVYKNLLGKYRNYEAVVVDTRFNGGGWLHDDLATLLSGKEYEQFKPRGQYIGSDPFNKWNKPSAVLMCEGNYSDASGFPSIYQYLKIGKLVGTPVPGTMTAVWWENQINPRLVFGVPQVTVVDMQGRPKENQEILPDVTVYNSPESLINGDDLQLKKAIDELIKELPAKKK